MSLEFEVSRWMFLTASSSRNHLKSFSSPHLLGSEEDDEHVLMIFTLLAAVPIALFVTLHMFLTVQRTDQIEPEAWALVMFSSCDVTIRTTYGLYLVMYVLAGTSGIM